MIKRRAIITIAMLLGIPLIWGCSTGMKAYRDLDSATMLQSKDNRSNTLIYKKPDAKGQKYNKFLFDPVEIYQGTDADFKGISLKDQKEMISFIDSEFKRVLTGRYAIVEKPGPNVLRIKFTMVGLDVTRPVPATATHLIPVGLAANLLKGAVGMKGSFMGSITIAGEFYDTEDDSLVYSFLTKRGPNAMDVTTLFTGLYAAKHAVSDMAAKFQDTIDTAQGRPGR
jgi:hypothetical protein